MRRTDSSVARSRYPSGHCRYRRPGYDLTEEPAASSSSMQSTVGDETSAEIGSDY